LRNCILCSAQKEEHGGKEKIKSPQLQRSGTVGKCEVMSNDFIGKTEFHVVIISLSCEVLLLGTTFL
jgi:hypothetical protein